MAPLNTHREWTTVVLFSVSTKVGGGFRRCFTEMDDLLIHFRQVSP
jgi:hypothetical protein